MFAQSREKDLECSRGGQQLRDWHGNYFVTQFVQLIRKSSLVPVLRVKDNSPTIRA